MFFINDMPICVESSTVEMFADDAECYKKVRNRKDCENLQSDIDNLYEWSILWVLRFNPIKCKLMTFTRSVSPINLYSYIDIDLSEKSQMANIVSKF